MLNPNSIFRKTEAGLAEIQARTLRLRAELRRLLILIDGNTPLIRLAAFVRGSEVDALIAELETLGLVTSATIGSAAGFGQPAPPAIPAAPVAPAAPIASTPVAAVSSSSGSDGVLEPSAAQVLAVRRAAIHTLRDILGPAADAQAVKIEKCKDAQDLRTTITEVRQALDRQMGLAVGQRFLDAVRGAAEDTR